MSRLGPEARRVELLTSPPPLSLVTGGVTKLGLTKFEAKIGQENEPSIRMFQKLHFKQVRVSSVGRLREAELLVLGSYSVSLLSGFYRWL